MTNNSDSRAVIRDFGDLIGTNFNSNSVDDFHAKVHRQFPMDFDLHFSLMTMIALTEVKDFNKKEADSFPIFCQAFQRQRSWMNGRSPDYLGYMQNIGNQFAQDRQFHLAASVFGEVLETVRGQMDREISWLVHPILNLATVYLELERFEDSIALYREALTILASEPEATPEHAGAWHGLARVYDALGNLNEAEKAQHRTLDLYRALTDVDSNDVADVLHDLGKTHRAQGRAGDAFKAFQEALDLQQFAAVSNHAAIVLTLNGLGSLHYDRDELEEAEAFYKEARLLADQYLTASDPGLAITLNNIAQIEARKGQFQEVLTLMEKAARLRQAMHPAQHSEVLSTLRNLSHAYASARDLDQAVATASEALDMELAKEQFPVSNKRLLARKRPAEEGLGLLLSLIAFQTLIGHKREWTEQVAALLTYKGNAEIERGLASILQAAATGELKDILDRRQTLQANIAQARYVDEDKSDLTIDWLEELQRVEGALEKHSEARRLADELRLRTIQSESVCAALRPNEALLNYFVVGGGEGVFAQILHQDGGHHLVRLEADGVEVQVEKLQQLLRSSGGEALYLSHPELQELLHALYEALLRPIETALRLGSALQSLVVSGDGHLYSLPWDLLMREGESGSVTLLQQLSVRLIPTPRDLVRLHRMQELQAETLSTALLLGVQDFEGATEHEDGTQERGAGVAFPTRAGLAVADGKLLPRYQNLAGTRSEVERLAQTFERYGLNTVKLLSPHATEQTLLHLDSAPSVLHFATHSDIWTLETAQAHYTSSGQINDVMRDPAHPFSRAVVVLDGYDRKSFRGVLRAWEVASMNLSGTQLITFSSCDSGLGDMTAGRSVAGLSQAAFLAGARRTITTLWPVLDADDDAPRWMAKVYQHRLDDASWQEAVRKSKLDMMEDEYPLGAWAPFILNGLA